MKEFKRIIHYCMKINDLSSDEKIKNKTFSFGLILQTLVDVTLIALFMKVCLIIS